MFSIVISVVLIQRETIRRLLGRRELALQIFTSIGLLVILYYPERAMSYLTPSMSILCAYVICNLETKYLRKALWGMVPFFVMLIAFSLLPVGFITIYGPSLYITLTIGLLLIIIISSQNAERFFIICFILTMMGITFLTRFAFFLAIFCLSWISFFRSYTSIWGTAGGRP